MKILSVSTATNFLTISLSENEKLIKQVEEKDQRNHSEHLDPMIDKLLKDCNLSLNQIDRFAVAIGPGSYTGLRIGITTMKMFASILNKEIVGISTLQALAANKQTADSLTLVCLDARNDNFFAGAYTNGTEVIPDGHYSLEALLKDLKIVLADKNIQKLIILGSGMDNHKDLLNSLSCDIIWGNEEENLVHASQIAKLALTSEVIDADQLVPRYLRRTQAEMDWHKKTGKPFEPDSNYVEEV
ncbi:tRNA (adenosine(37)-N6)-threonylcarbamoyltransferase complex dimerization subunit type 1 TsaB [Lactobacillus mulieris]|jgi:universal bacterial protein yeaZ|nr:tRNA (adenosine(37)-N6)-threonylcarbamoyltransferase complex dimerization subunit type 1 TsaB [Lactobacillus mulieris]EEU20719.1 universal bacterial protein YeaZ [Lactobacillus jensenii 27-2-CHN]EEX23745.1 universal bacterial protein YeaZ [Lactobacillus jensenii 115-3-CHN]EFH29881.1 universal bacterial protein YeaZ [Lactobacillus jensenii JV-V16]KAA9245525.1 tRNA (adenosine(37)-N6)-threonylcarbamoyltransferase complex dimerization subunit type 1 TsaB [Lactobacillus jensenii]KAA9369026.1 tRN